MAIPAVNIQFLDQPGTGAQGQVAAMGVSGRYAKRMIGVGTATLDGSLTAFTINFIDGAQKLFNSSTSLSVGSVAAPATIGGVANQAVYTSVGPVGALRVGQTITFAGFSNSGNNGSFTINALTTSTIQVTNSSSVAESNPQGSGLVVTGAHVAAVLGLRSLYSASGVADTAANTVSVSKVDTITDATAQVTISGAGSAAQTLSVLVEVFPSA